MPLITITFYYSKPTRRKILFVNFTLFIRKFIIFIDALGYTRHVAFLLFRIIIFIIFVENFII